MPRKINICPKCGTENKTYRCRRCAPVRVYTVVNQAIGFRMRKRLTEQQADEYRKFGYMVD